MTAVLVGPCSFMVCSPFAIVHDHPDFISTIYVALGLTIILTFVLSGASSAFARQLSAPRAFFTWAS